MTSLSLTKKGSRMWALLFRLLQVFFTVKKIGMSRRFQFENSRNNQLQSHKETNKLPEKYRDSDCIDHWVINKLHFTKANSRDNTIIRRSGNWVLKVDINNKQLFTSSKALFYDLRTFDANYIGNIQKLDLLFYKW